MRNTKTCPKCGLFTDHRDGALVERARALGRPPCPFDQLMQALGGFELTDQELRHVRWLASGDYTTVEAFCGIFQRLVGAEKLALALLRCPRQVKGGRCAGLDGHEGPCYANARERAAENG
jgi:hypothetical protein